MSVTGGHERWRPGTQCQANYKGHFYDATITRCIGKSGRKFRVQFDDFSVGANVRAEDLRERSFMSEWTSAARAKDQLYRQRAAAEVGLCIYASVYRYVSYEHNLY